jgi:hypothetical protein
VSWTEFGGPKGKVDPSLPVIDEDEEEPEL